jgi:uncharacterized membrane protein YjgN (DUF898 family)
VEPSQIIFGGLLVVGLLGMAGYFIWRQWQTLRWLKSTTEIASEDRRFTHRQAWRRLICSVLLVVLAGMLAASFFLEEPANVLAARGEANREQGKMRPLDPAEQQFFRVYQVYWVVFLTILLVVISLAAADFFAIRRYGRQQYRQIQEDRRAMIEGELARLRSQRNGHG